MTESLQAQIDKVRSSISGLEAQRSVLGDETVNIALGALQQQLARLEEQASTQAIPGDERRVVTILFIDMVGSTSMAEKLDPEEWRQVVSQLQNALSKAISAHHGTVAQYLGDGILAFFGSKQASEHDPENAIRAALDAHAAVSAMPVAEKVQLRVGIHTGLVVVGELGDAVHKEFTASGDAMNLAARLQSAAPAGGTLISHDTYRYVRGVFDMTPRPPLSVKGKSEPLQTYLVRRAKPRPFRSVTRGVAGVETRTIGRDAEMQALKQAYLKAYEGHGMMWAQLLGEPGVGKSRLLVDLTDWLDLREENFRLLRARAFTDDTNQPFALVRRMWFDRFQIAEDTPLESAETKWVDHFREFSGLQDYEEPAHALGLLVGLTFENSPHIKGMRNDPTQVMGRAMVVSRELVRAVRREYPIVILLEDLQWTDSASWEYLIEVFLDSSVGVQDNGLFILGAARNDWHPPEQLDALVESSTLDGKDTEKWGMLINLSPLSDIATRQLAQELLQRAVEVPDGVIDLLVERSEGMPYFIEEIINWFIDHEILNTLSEQWKFLPEKLKAQPLPATLQHLLLTRLSSLSQPERDALQRGAIFGRHFWTGGVEALGIPSGEETLSHLQPRGFVEAQPESAFQGDTEWSFHHNLLQEVTYESVLKRERAGLHKVAAGWLETQALQAGRLDEFAGLLGDHYERAGELSTAVDWYLRAGMRTFAKGAPREASEFYTQALKLLPPIDRERRWQALLGREEALSVLADAEPWKADINDLLELAGSFEDENYLAEAYLRQAKFGMSSGDIPISDHASREAFATARRCGNEAIEAKALVLIAVVGIHRDDKLAAVEHVEEALQLARSIGDENVLAYVLFRAAFCYGEIGNFARWYPLYIEQIELNHHLGNRIQEAMALGNFASSHLGSGLYKQARVLLEHAIQITQSVGAHRLLAYDLMNLGDVYRVTGDLRKAHQLMEQALQEISSTPDARGKAYALGGLGLVLFEMDDPSGASRRIREAHELALSHGLSGLACETTIGLAACAVILGQLDEASKYVHEGWDYLKAHGWTGMGYPGKAYLTCAEIFDALGDTDNFQAVLDIGYKALLEVADTKNISEWRQSFLENVPEHRALIEMWERSKR
jgi:class 3 adenylate cyclase/tetratricopeptide (TPR) repeat protein